MPEMYNWMLSECRVALACQPIDGRAVSQRRRASASTDNQRDHEEHQENDEQYFCDADRSPCNAKETKRAGDQGDDQKYDCIVEHGELPLCPREENAL